jgi:hypothetical protein
MKIKLFQLLVILFLPMMLFAQNLEEGMVGWYRFNQGLEDQSPFQIEGIGYNLEEGVGLEDEAETCFFYNGDDAYVYLSEDNRGIQNQVSISAWVKTTDVKRQFVVGKYYSEEDKGYFLAVDDGLALIGGRNATGNFYQCLSTSRVNDGKWHHVVGIIDGNNWEIWIDCQLENTLQSSGINSNMACSHPLTVGNWHEGVALGTPRFFNGLIDEARIYNRALEVAEIQLLCVETMVAMDEPGQSKEQINVYPVPGRDIIHVDYGGPDFGPLKYQLLDASGKKNTQGDLENKSLIISHLPSGLYFLQIFHQGKLIAVEKIVKQGDVQIP